MIKTKYLIIAAAALLFVVIAGGVAIVSLPFIFDRGNQPVPDFTETQPPITFPTATPIVIFITNTPQATPTDLPATAVPTALPTQTPVPTVTNTPAPTSVPIPCDAAAFVSDVTIPDGTDLIPGEEFVKTWRIKNIGSCTWTTSYALVFSSGNALGAANTKALSGNVRPGETIDVSISMKAPEADGTYTGYWLLRNAAGEIFGLGDSRNKPVWVTVDVALPCYWASFVNDVTVPDGTVFAPNVPFTKTWRIKNIGSCTWASSFDIVHVSGDKMGATIGDLPQRVRPGETVDVSVALTSPGKPGDYRGFWKLKADNGTLFGIGKDQSNPVWVDIDVININTGFVFDFAANFCSAVWKSNVGTLPCPGKSGDSNGFVVHLSNPNLENRKEDEPALWTTPFRAENGWITGKYPAVKISDGNHFKAWVGCLNGNKNCNVTFFLDYQVDGGPIKNLGTWHEIYDEKVTEIDIDLSSLAGQNVTFSLSVEVTGGKASEANAFWFVPRIE